MTSLTHPHWQSTLREAQSAMGKRYWDEEPLELQQDRMQGSKLYLVLKTFFGVPLPKGTILRNYYTADGLWFRLKFAARDVAADGHPLYASTTALSGHQKSPTKASTTFTLYVGHVTPDESYPDWPRPKALVVRDLGLVNTNYTRIQAQLADILDEVETDYQSELPRYEAWKAIELMPSDPAMQTDYLRQLIRLALRRMPALEVLPLPPEPVEVVGAVLQDALAQMDGLRLGGAVTATESATLASLEEKANAVIAMMDELYPPDEQKDFDGYDAFDPDDEPDDLDDDTTDPDASDYDDATEPAAV